MQVIVVEVGPKKAGLVIDSLLGREDVVAKPLTGVLGEDHIALTEGVSKTGNENRSKRDANNCIGRY